jgi:hypothetical protein
LPPTLLEGDQMHYEVERLNMAGRWIRSGGIYKLLTDAKRQATAARKRGSLVRIVRVAEDGSREVVEE